MATRPHECKEWVSLVGFHFQMAFAATEINTGRVKPSTFSGLKKIDAFRGKKQIVAGMRRNDYIEQNLEGKVL